MREYNGFLVSASPRRREPGAVRLRPRLRASDLLRHARAGQGLDRQLGLSLGDRQCRLHVAARAAGLSRGRRADPRSRPTTPRGGWREIKGVRIPLRAGLLQGIRRRLRRHRQDGGARSTRRCAKHGIFGGKDLSDRVPRTRPERALLRDRNPHAGRHRPAGRRRSTEVVCDERRERLRRLSRRRLGRAAGHGAGPSRPARPGLSRSPSRRSTKAVGDARTSGARRACARTSRRRCPSCPSPRCSATTCISRRRRWA